VTRLKANSPVQVITENKVEQPANILRDCKVMLNERLKASRKNPLSKPLRMIEVEIGSKRKITLISNDLDSTAETIAELYKKRWQIELFFKWVKQNLKLSHFLGASRNAIIIQIMAALIAYMLVRIVQIKAKATLGLQAIARLSTALMLARRPISDILNPPRKRAQSPTIQLNFWKAYA